MKRWFMIVVVALMGAALAQEYTAEDFAMLVASELDAVMADCPAQYYDSLDEGYTLACFEDFGDMDLMKSKLERFARQFDDTTPVGPWELTENRRALFRVYLVAEEYLVSYGIEELADYDVRVAVLVTRLR